MTHKLYTTDYLFTGKGAALENQFIALDETQTICKIGPVSQLPEKAVHLKGAICPGFINSHIHTELAHMQPSMFQTGSMASFIEAMAVNKTRIDSETRREAIKKLIEKLYNEGVSGAGDICNEPVSFDLKTTLPVRWHHFIEYYGMDEHSMNNNFKKGLLIRKISEASGFRASLTPHSPYSVHHAHKGLLQQKTRPSDLISYHFMESLDEVEYLINRGGPLAVLFERWNSRGDHLGEGINSPLKQLTATIGKNQRIMLVHNTFISQKEIKEIHSFFEDPWFCLCPQSNKTITGTMPPAEDIRALTNKILIGTDSSASNPNISVWAEIVALKKAYPAIPLEEILSWATFNGATFYDWEELGSIEPGKRPGLVWLENFSDPADSHLCNVRPRRVC